MRAHNEIDDLAAQRHVEQVVAAANTSFFWGMRILPAERRAAMYAVYAFCREVDDIADEGGDLDAKRRDLACWRAEIDRLYEGRPEMPTARALLGPVRRYDLPREEFLALIEGMETDAEPAIHGLSEDELRLYCRRVAGAVGLLSVRVFGDPSETARDLAVAQGDALQLTNILRDLAEDAARDRLYLPHELLDRHGIASRVPAEVLAHPALPAVCAELAARARAAYGRVDDLLRHCDRRAMRPAVIMLESYRAILDRLERRGWSDPHIRVKVPKPVKLWLVLRHGWLAR